ncbi:MAG TPA: DUF2079 domain-containing protein [Actinomycetes bacterium]|nr:DUF2079 domain-containing protein [Actinomycetes bacterium]
MVAPPPVRPPGARPAAPWPGPWLPAADLALDSGRAATVSFDRHGRCRLTLALDRPASDDDLRALEDAADVLPHLRLEDLPGGAGFPERHAEAFALPMPLPPDLFNRGAEVELLAPPGGARPPARLGRYGLPVRTPAPAAEAGPAPTDGAVETALLGLGRRLVAATRTDGATLCDLAVAACVAVFVVAFIRQTWTIHARYGTYGFDLGIFQQGTWLLSRLQAPFVTVRGLNLFGDHASYILLLVAPLYRLWPDPRLLLTLQVLALAVPAVVVYRLGTRHLGHQAAGLAVAVAYLAYPAMQWAATWQFHCETLAAGFLALAALAADRRRWRAMTVLLALALLCKEDVGLVVAGFGLFLVLGGHRRVGWRAAAAGLGWFVLCTFLLIPLVNGRSSPHLELNFGISDTSLPGLLGAIPLLASKALAMTMSDRGTAYLALVVLPLAGLPLLAPRWLLPVAAPLFFNLAATPGYNQEIRYQYLATSAPFLAIATVGGLAAVKARRRALLAPLLLVLVAAAGVADHRYGSAPWSTQLVVGPPSPLDATRQRAMALVDPDSPASVQYNLVTHLGNRRRIYEFPNPFRAANWGLSGDEHSRAEVDALRWVLVQRDVLGKDDRELLKRIQGSPAWRTRFDQGGIVLLERVAAGGPP